ncbi:MAG: peptide chain release factor-like protein, partial [Solirubrobacteraceae bacterium]
MSGLLQITRTLAIPLDEVTIRASRSSGPGGQHANVTASRIEASFDVAASGALDEAQKRQITARCGPVVRAVAQDARSQARNRELALERLADRLIVRGFDAVLDGRFPHLLLEHLEGPTLLALLERHGPLPPEQALPLALHVAAALHYLAGEDTVHLDVKPSNVVMGAPPRLIDLSVTRSRAAAARLRRP